MCIYYQIYGMDAGSLGAAIKSIDEICAKETQQTAIDDPESRKIICKLTQTQVKKQ